jgi:hypothetical protein
MSNNLNTKTTSQVVDITCPATGYQPATVCVPVTVTPFAHPLPTTTYCCNDPIVTPGTDVCPGELNGSCTFTITQEICIAVPVEFGATAEVDDPSVVCGEATDIDVCTDCGNGDSTLAAGGCPTCKKQNL